jgi:chorismate mutase
MLTDPAADNNIAKLPETWDEEGVEDDSSQARRYQELAENLRRLSERRKELKERVARYKALKDGLNPFENARESVQENLCTRDGEVERELEKMRLLMARVSGRIEGLPMRKEDEDEMDIDDNASGGGLDTIDEDAKLRALLDLV